MKVYDETQVVVELYQLILFTTWEQLEVVSMSYYQNLKAHSKGPTNTYDVTKYKPCKDAYSLLQVSAFVNNF